MAHLARHLNHVQREMEDAVRHVGPFMESLARFGLCARGTVYVLLGTLAGLSAVGWRRSAVGTSGVFRHLWREPFGLVILIVVAAGLVCFGGWLVVRAIRDPENDGKLPFGFFRRVGFFFGGLANVGLAMVALSVVIGARRAARGDEVEDWTKLMMSYPLGRWIAAAIGIGVIIYGIVQIYMGFDARLDRHLRMREIGKNAGAGLRIVSRFGLAARGIVFTLVGLFLIFAAWYNDPREARGIGGALYVVSVQPLGALLLSTVAAGLIAFGIYQFILARYREIEPL